jgi:uncharacterized protein YecE (DUF72 family)
MDGLMTEFKFTRSTVNECSDPASFDRDHIKAAVATLAREGVFVGTSSWKYPGWRGQLYTADRYVWRGKFSEKRFEQLCLSEYSEVFKTVCVDAAYYKFPDSFYMKQLVEAVPPDFLFGLKVTDEITIKRFSNLPRFGERAGKMNQNYLNADLFSSAFLESCKPFQNHIGVILFEFSRFHSLDYEAGRLFIADLESFFRQLPRGWPYAVEIRNKTFLQPDYFAALQRHSVAHVYNSWSEMPFVNEQLQLPGSRTSLELCPARFLLKPGRAYEEAVKLFSPYNKTKEVNSPAREAGAALIREGRTTQPSRRTFVFVNNRLEGNALNTIAAMIEKASRETIAPSNAQAGAVG